MYVCMYVDRYSHQYVYSVHVCIGTYFHKSLNYLNDEKRLFAVIFKKHFSLFLQKILTQSLATSATFHNIILTYNQSFSGKTQKLKH